MEISDKDLPILNGHLIRSRRKRRVALFSGAYNHVVDGISLTLNRLVGHLESRGYEVMVFAPTMGEPALQHNGIFVEVPSFKIPFRTDYLVSMGLIGEARKRIEEFEPDLVHIATPDYLGLSALLYALRRDIPVVSGYHTHFSSYLKYYRLQAFDKLIWRYLRWTYGKGRHLYVPTPSMIDLLREHGIYENVRLWSRGIDNEHFNPAHRSIGWRRRLNIRDDEVVVLFVSRLVWEKSLDVLADALNHLHDRGVRHRTVVIGSGPAYAELRDMTPDDTIYLGYVGGTDLATAYASSDIFLFPSSSETFGNVTLEAMASGLPIVCANAAGSASIVANHVVGLRCPAGDGLAFAVAVEKLVADPSLRRGMGLAAVEESQGYSWDVVLADMCRYYDEVLGEMPTERSRSIRPASRRQAAAAG